MNFKEVYKFPLKHYWGKVMTDDNEMAFDFVHSWDSNPETLKIGQEEQKHFISIINGDNDKQIHYKINAEYDDSYIYVTLEGEKLEFMSIRGWGHLTGMGGLNLHDDEAVRIQDEFGQYIAERINLACSKDGI